MQWGCFGILLQNDTNTNIDVLADAELAMNALAELSALIRIGVCMDDNCAICSDTFINYMRMCQSKIDLIQFLLPHCLPLS